METKKDSKIKKVLMEITIDEDRTLEWVFDESLTPFHMYAVYGLLTLIQEDLKNNLLDDFETEK